MFASDHRSTCLRFQRSLAVVYINTTWVWSALAKYWETLGFGLCLVADKQNLTVLKQIVLTPLHLLGWECTIGCDIKILLVAKLGTNGLHT